jgi:hypothetical protein
MKGRLGDVALAGLELGGQPRPGLGWGLVAGRRRRGHLHPPHPRQPSRTATRPCGCSPPPTPSTSAPDVGRLADRRCCCSMSSAASPGGGPWPSTSWSGPGRGALGSCSRRRVTVTERHRARLNQDQVRAARVGEAQIIAAGRVERTRIIQTAIPAETHSRVEALLSHGPSRPLEAPRGNSQEPDERRTSAPPRRAPADNQPGGPGPAAGAVRLAGLTAPPIAGALHPFDSGAGARSSGGTATRPAASRVCASGAASRRP